MVRTDSEGQLPSKVWSFEWFNTRHRLGFSKVSLLEAFANWVFSSSSTGQLSTGLFLSLSMAIAGFHAVTMTTTSLFSAA